MAGKALRSTPQNLQVVYEDNHVIAVNKRAGDIVQGDHTGDMPLSEVIKEYLKIKYNKQGNVYCGVVHRLDRPVSGLVLFARTSKALPRLNASFSTREVQKTYWAVVKQAPPQNEGRLVHQLYKVEKQNKSYVSKEVRSDSKEARLHYRLLAKSNDYYLLEILPETGRHHQIRVQLAAMGCPIKGDLKYGFDRSNPNGGIHLHARALSLIHPVKKEPVSWVAPVPDDPLWQYFQGVAE